MESYIKPPTIRGFLNQIFRRTQRVDITPISNKVLTIRNVYKNKQIIDVIICTTNRFNQKI